RSCGKRPRHRAKQRDELATAAHLITSSARATAYLRYRSRLWEFLSLPNCAMEVLVHTRRHGLVVLIGDMFAYHLRIPQSVTANAAMPLVAVEDVRTPLGAFRVIFGIGHFNNPS